MSREINIYEFSLYNSEVRALVQVGDSHRRYDDTWAEQRYIQVKAQNVEVAREQILRRYPKAKGFVYTDMIKFID